MFKRASIRGYEGVYEISEDGRVYSLSRHFVHPKGHKVSVPQRERKNRVSAHGYLTVNLRLAKTLKTYLVHRLVAEAFLPNPLQLPFVNHIDGNKQNPSVSNLEWTTPQGNASHAVQTGLIDFKGEANPGAKVTDEQVEEALTRCLAGELLGDVSTEMGLSRHTLPKRFKNTSRAHLWQDEVLKRKSMRRCK